MKKLSSIIKKLNPRTIMYIIVIILVAVISISISNNIEELFTTNEPEISNTYIGNKLEEIGELTSAQLTYNGIISYSDGKIPFLTKKSFLMTYRAEVEAGIKIENVDIKITKSTVQITLPETDILDVYVVPDSIRFFDENFSLFNGEKKEDVLDAIAVAEADVVEKGDMEELKSKAKNHTELLMQKILESSIGEKELVIAYK